MYPYACMCMYTLATIEVAVPMCTPVTGSLSLSLSLGLVAADTNLAYMYKQYCLVLNGRRFLVHL